MSSYIPSYIVTDDDAVIFDIYPHKEFRTGSVLLVRGNSEFSKCVLCSQKLVKDCDNQLNISHVAILVVEPKPSANMFVELYPHKLTYGRDRARVLEADKYFKVVTMEPLDVTLKHYYDSECGVYIRPIIEPIDINPGPYLGVRYSAIPELISSFDPGFDKHPKSYDDSQYFCSKLAAYIFWEARIVDKLTRPDRVLPKHM